MDLSTQSSIGSALLISISVPGEPVTTFSTYWKALTVDTVNYVGLGSLMSITDTANELRATPQELSIVISGIPSSNQDLATNDLLRGSPISILRYVFDPVTGEGLAIDDNPTGRFYGIVNNYSMEFETDSQDRSGTLSIVLNCSSTVEQLNNKVAGRKTTPEDMKRYAPGDLSFDRVASLARSNFNFGAPQ